MSIATGADAVVNCEAVMSDQKSVHYDRYDRSTRAVATAELLDAALDWAVAKSRGITDDRISLQGQVQFSGEKAIRQQARVSVRWLLKEYTPPAVWAHCHQIYAPSIDPLHSSAIIDEEMIATYPMPGGVGGSWRAERWGEHLSAGPTRSIAALRCFVAFKLGPQIEVPSLLLPPQRQEERQEEYEASADAIADGARDRQRG